MRKGTLSRRLSFVFALLLFIALILCLALGEIRMPETGKNVKKNGDLTVDCSHMSEGYVMVKAKKSSKKLKVRVKMKDATLNYDLNGSGEYEVYPLQFGNGKYQFSLYKNASGKKYSEEGKIDLNVKMSDANTCFLYPNQYVNYTEKTECVKKATELCEGTTDPAKIYKTICGFVEKNFVYDFVKAATVKGGMLPDIDGCWKKRMGICQDLSAVTIAMMRSQGLPARLMIGTLGSGTYHAWVTAVVNGEEQFFDPTAEINKSSKKDTYTTERIY